MGNLLNSALSFAQNFELGLGKYIYVCFPTSMRFYKELK